MHIGMKRNQVAIIRILVIIVEKIASSVNE